MRSVRTAVMSVLFARNNVCAFAITSLWQWRDFRFAKVKERRSPELAMNCNEYRILKQH